MDKFLMDKIPHW